MLPDMGKPASKGLSIAYVVVAITVCLMVCISAVTKLTLNPDAVHVITEVVGVPINWLPVLAACEIAGGVGLVVGIFRPKIGVAAGVGLVLYFVGAMLAHVRVADWAGITAPIMPLALSTAALVLRIKSHTQDETPRTTDARAPS